MTLKAKIQAELAGDNSNKEASFVERLYTGIKHRYTRRRWNKHGTQPSSNGYRARVWTKLRDAGTWWIYM